MAAPAFIVRNQNATRVADPELREALSKYARRRLPPGEIEDLIQNTLTEALISSNAPSDLRDFQRWIHGIARHKIADSYRRRGRSAALGVDIEATAGEPAAEPGELLQWIESELPKTDGAHATLHWLLRESDGESLDEIARDAALPAPRVRQRVSRLRRHFHARWLALGAAGLLLLLVAGLLLRSARETSSVPPIARELAGPQNSAHPRAVGAAVPDPSVPAAAPEFGTKGAPKPLAPSKVRSNDGRSKPAPKKKIQPKVKPMPVQKALSSNDSLPSKALGYDAPGDSKPSEQFAGAKKKE
ncbi:MAG: RNA polymerase sigma factor [Polyangiaceae bacterium]